MEYLECIVESLNIFYQRDRELIQNDTHEQSYGFRIAKYLSEILESGSCSYRIDCEYNREGYDGDPKRIKAGLIKPDIIYHKRLTEENIFVIEIKKKDNNGKDLEKVKNIMEILKYKRGFCIDEIKAESIIIWEIFILKETVSHKYSFDGYKLIKNNYS